MLFDAVAKSGAATATLPCEFDELSYDVLHNQLLKATVRRLTRTKAVSTAAEQAHEVLIHPPAGISNVTEWAKKQACWERVRKLSIKWPQGFVTELISADEQRDTARTARRDQRELNGIEAQIAVVQAGGQFWADALAWGQGRKLLTAAETGVLRVCVPRARADTD